MALDAHCHLDQLDRADEAVAEAVDSGVSPILAVSMDASAAESVLRFKEKWPGRVLAGIGLHPSRVPEMTSELVEKELHRLEGLLPGADFVGEIGLDYKDAVTQSERSRQRETLERQMAWAEKRGLPVNLHSRRADRDVLNAAIDFHDRTGLGALMHWFTHSEKLARICAQRGIFISVGPSVLIDGRTAELARGLGGSILLVETDSPVEYGSMGPARPVWARRVLSELARLRATSEESLEASLHANLERYLGRDVRKEHTAAPCPPIA